MIDPVAVSLFPGNIRGLFQRVNGAPMYDILDTFDALAKQKGFNPDFNAHRANLDSAGIFVQRMEVALSAVMAKTAIPPTTWEKFEGEQVLKLRQLPADQQLNIKSYLFPGGVAALSGPADIKVIANEIKLGLAGAANRDIEFLARLFEDDRIADRSAGLPGRLLTILAASSDGSNNGVTHFAGIYGGCTDQGFRTEFKDPWPGFSDNQVGHFTTAVDMGFRPEQTYALLPAWARAAVFLGTSGDLQAYMPEDICIRLIIGHEQVADNAPDAFKQQAKSASEADVACFERALRTLTDGLNQNLRA